MKLIGKSYRPQEKKKTFIRGVQQTRAYPTSCDIITPLASEDEILLHRNWQLCELGNLNYHVRRKGKCHRSKVGTRGVSLNCIYSRSFNIVTIYIEELGVALRCVFYLKLSRIHLTEIILKVQVIMAFMVIMVLMAIRHQCFYMWSWTEMLFLSDREQILFELRQLPKVDMTTITNDSDYNHGLSSLKCRSGTQPTMWHRRFYRTTQLTNSSKSCIRYRKIFLTEDGLISGQVIHYKRHTSTHSFTASPVLFRDQNDLQGHLSLTDQADSAVWRLIHAW